MTVAEAWALLPGAEVTYFGEVVTVIEVFKSAVKVRDKHGVLWTAAFVSLGFV